MSDTLLFSITFYQFREEEKQVRIRIIWRKKTEYFVSDCKYFCPFWFNVIYPEIIAARNVRDDKSKVPRYFRVSRYFRQLQYYFSKFDYINNFRAIKVNLCTACRQLSGALMYIRIVGEKNIFWKFKIPDKKVWI